MYRSISFGSLTLKGGTWVTCVLGVGVGQGLGCGLGGALVGKSIMICIYLIPSKLELYQSICMNVKITT